MKFKRALVTGGAGFIGSHIAEALVSRNVEVIVLDNLSVGKRSNLPRGAHLITGDIRKKGDLNRSLKGVDIVFHNAARVGIRGSVQEFYDDARSNIFGTLELLQALRSSSVKKCVYASSMAVYGSADYLPIDENHPCQPISPYGISKLAAERYILSLCKAMDIDAVCLRYFNTFGIRQTLTPYVGVITIFINRLLQGKPPVIFGDGSQVRDFISAKDVAEANMLAMEGDFKSEVFNIGSGQGTSVAAIADLLIGQVANAMKKEFAPAQKEEPGSSIASIDRARNRLKFEPRFKLEEEIGGIIDWIKYECGS